MFKPNYQPFDKIKLLGQEIHRALKCRKHEMIWRNKDEKFKWISKQLMKNHCTHITESEFLLLLVVQQKWRERKKTTKFFLNTQQTAQHTTPITNNKQNYYRTARVFFIDWQPVEFWPKTQRKHIYLKQKIKIVRREKHQQQQQQQQTSTTYHL